MAISGGVLSVASIPASAHRIEIMPITFVAVTVATLASRRSKWKIPPAPARRILIAAPRSTTVVVVSLVVVLNAALIEILDPLTNAVFEEIFGGPATPDFSQLVWATA